MRIMSPIFMVSVILIASSSVFCIENTRPNYIQCVSNLECDPGYCCTIGAMRYSIPQCQPLQKEGNPCRPGSAITINMTAMYPDGAEVLLTNVHSILCPCADGLTCDPNEIMCKNAKGKSDANRLFDQDSKGDD
ncbi:astakine [Calliopsis andreniformis]|uniref:astakine n=1 Tax=Calliopsis andreniformis TaxID=337506 RepID=UPI003FCE3002